MKIHGHDPQDHVLRWPQAPKWTFVAQLACSSSDAQDRYQNSQNAPHVAQSSNDTQVPKMDKAEQSDAEEKALLEDIDF